MFLSQKLWNNLVLMESSSDLLRVYHVTCSAGEPLLLGHVYDITCDTSEEGGASAQTLEVNGHTEPV